MTEEEKPPTLDEYIGKPREPLAVRFVDLRSVEPLTVAEIFADHDRRAAMKCTVAEMIAKLQALGKPDAVVVLEGCDCTGRASGEVVVDRDGECSTPGGWIQMNGPA